MGVAVTTASIAVGARCPFASSGVGAVVTQNRTHPLIGPRALALLEEGIATDLVARQAAQAFDFPEWRQIALIDAYGRVGTYHGTKCSGRYAEARGEAAVALGNLLTSEAVPTASLEGFFAASGSLEERLLAGLDAGLAAGGEVKPLRSAALVVVDQDAFPYTHLRIDADEVPLRKLRELWHAWQPTADTCRRWALDPDNA